MKNNKFLKSTLILIVGSLITKVMGFIIKIIYTRIIGSYGISLYTLIVPTYSLMISISNFALPVSLSKLISQNKIRSKEILSSGIYLILFINILFMFVVIFSSGFISVSLLNDPRVKVLLIGASLSMPFMGLACILKGYFYGKQMMMPNSISNVIEQTIRLLFLIFILPKIANESIIKGILSYLLLNIVTELSSIIVFLFLLPKGIKINIKDIKYNKKITKSIFFESFPLVSSRLIGNIGFFFEPIILSNLFKYLNYSSDFFLKEYGIYNGYSLSLLMLPSFIVASLCSALIPEISKYNTIGNTKMIKRRIKQSIVISFMFGLFITLFIFIYRDNLLFLLYKTNLGSNYIAYLSLFFIFYYLEAPLSSILQALDYSKFTFKTTSFGVIIKLATMSILSLFRIGLYSLVVAEAVNIIYVVIRNFMKIKKIVY